MFNASEITASLTVADIKKSTAWYRDVIGFEVQQEHERDGAVRAVALKAGNVRILLNQEDGKKGWDRKKGQGFSLQFITSNGGTLDSEPADMPWGVRMFRLTDPDGFKFAFSAPLNGA